MDDQRGHRKNRQAHLKIFIGADHRGFRLKAKIIKLLGQKGYDVVDVGAYDDKRPSDYPQFSLKVAMGVVRYQARGMLICMTGLGHAIAANKIPGVRAVVCYNKKLARLSRAHNDANILILGAKFVSKKELWDIIETWLKTPFEGGRHLRRLNQIRRMEKNRFKEII